MPYTQTSTSLGALSAAGAGSFVNVPRGAQNSVAGPIVLIVASAVTSGGVVSIEVNTGRHATREVHRVTIAANGNTVIPLLDLPERSFAAEQVRVNVVSRTDGTFTCSLLTAA